MRIGFTAFYPRRSFWAIDGIDLNSPSIGKDFDNLMAEEVFERTENNNTIKIDRDGRISIRIEDIEASIEAIKTPGQNSKDKDFLEYMALKIDAFSQYLEHLNTFHLLLDSATIKIMDVFYFELSELTNKDAFRSYFMDNGGKSENFASYHQLSRHISSYSPGMRLDMDPRLSSRHVINYDTLDCCVNQYFGLFKMPGLVSILSSLAKSISEYQVGNYNAAIVTSWFISEKMINQKWEKHLRSINSVLTDGEMRLNPKRLELLKRKDISTITNILELIGLIDFGEFKGINVFRKLRNKIAHGLSDTRTASEAQHAIETTLRLIQSEYSKLELSLNFSYSISGL